MYPPKVDDEAIRRLIRELAEAGRVPSGAALRSALQERFGSRGGVSRIYRLLAAERGGRHAPPSGWGNVTAELLKLENEGLRDDLHQVRQREQRHQAHWEREIQQLREQIESLTRRVDAGFGGTDIEALRAQLQAAELREGRLEVMLATFGPAAGQAARED